MLAKSASIARRFVTTTPEEMEEFNSRLINYHVLIGILTSLRDQSDGGISQVTYKRAVKLVAENLGFTKGSIFYPTEYL